MAARVLTSLFQPATALVETAEQLRRLDQLGCALVPGFHLGPPAPAEDVWITPAPLLTA